MNNEKKLISLNELLRTGRVYWIDSFSTLRKWVLRDLEGNNYLKTKVIKRERTGTRYYIPVKNVDDFVRAFHNGTLYSTKKT